MIGTDRVIAVIPARGGSKAIPKKNLARLGGRPLIAWSIRVAQAARQIDRTIVSTDDDEIARTARALGAEVYLRPPQLATDSALVIDALRHLRRTLTLEGEAGDVMVLLEPTCPLRSSADVTACLRLIEGGCDSAATFQPATLHPHRAWRIVEGIPHEFIDGAVPWLPRQELPPAFELNGAVYAFRSAGLDDVARVGLLFGKSGAVIMPAERSVDIDTTHDLVVAEAFLQQNPPNK